ncbi:MAG: hypothetical protein AAGE89_14930 [Pseudomonadota bacterium]
MHFSVFVGGDGGLKVSAKDERIVGGLDSRTMAHQSHQRGRTNSNVKEYVRIWGRRILKSILTEHDFMPTYFIIYLAVTFLVVLCFLLPLLYYLLIFLTVGIMWLVVAVWPYWTLILPAYRLQDQGYSRIVCAAMGLFGVTGWAVLPSLYGEWAAPRYADNLRSDEFLKPLDGTWPVEGGLKEITFKRTETDWGKRYWNPIEYVACDPLCQRLLILGLVDRVNIYVELRRYSGGNAPVGSSLVSFHLEARKTACPRQGIRRYRTPTFLEMTKRAEFQGKCIIANQIKDVPDGIIIETARITSKRGGDLFVRWNQVETVSASLKKGNLIEPLLSKSWYRIDVPTKPTLLFLGGLSLSSPVFGGAGLHSRRIQINPLPFETALKDDLKLDFLPGRILGAHNDPYSPSDLSDHEDGFFKPDRESLLQFLSKRATGRLSEVTDEIVRRWINGGSRIFGILTDAEIRFLEVLSRNLHYGDRLTYGRMICRRPDLLDRIDVRPDLLPTRNNCSKPRVQQHLDNLGL